MTHHRSTRQRPTLLETISGIALAGMSGAAVLFHTFGPLPMSFTVPFVVIPAAVILGSMVLLGRNQMAHFHLAAKLVGLGGWAGGAATIAYDVVRPLLIVTFGFKFNPFAAIPVFGQLMTGVSPSDPIALTAGWVYHFWNGISFGMIFSLLRPKGGLSWGLLWGVGLAVLMLVTYPALLHIDPNSPGFLACDFLGHAVWGLTLGYIVERWSPI